MEDDNVILDNIDDFLPMPGADSIVTSPTVLTTEEEETIAIDETFKDELEDAIPSLNPEEELEDDEKKPVVKNKVKNNADVFKSLIDKELLIPFDDDKPLEEYTDKDWEDLIKSNFEEKEKELQEKTQKEFFEALPKELQMATKYVLDGGTDLQGMFRALAQTEQVKKLDVAVPEHHEHIVRAYLYAKNFGTQEQIEEQIEEWSEMNMLGKKATQFKPVIDEMQEEIVQQQVKKQEDYKKAMIAKRESYINNIADTLKAGELGGVKIDSKRQKMLFEEMTTTKYQSMTGRPTNLLGKLLEDYQFGDKPRYDLIAEAVWLLAEPDAYKESIRQVAKNETADEIARKLKTEQDNKTTTSNAPENKTEKRTIKRQNRNIFER
mgnify:CR=1 FL=1